MLIFKENENPKYSSFSFVIEDRARCISLFFVGLPIPTTGGKVVGEPQHVKNSSEHGRALALSIGEEREFRSSEDFPRWGKLSGAANTQA